MAYKLPEYLAGQVEMTTNAGVGQIDPKDLYYRQYAETQALEHLGSQINAVTQKIQKQEADNFVNQEQTAMIDNFTKWSGEASQKKGYDKVNYIETTSKAYLDDIRKRYADRPDLVNRIENSWQQNYAHYKAIADHEYKKEVVSESRAIVDEGNTKYLDSIYSLKATPGEIYRQLSEREKAIDGLVENKVYDAATGQAMKAELRNKTDVSRASMALEDNVHGALNALQNPNEFTFLDGRQRTTLINQAQSQIKQEEAQRRMEARLALQERKENFRENIAVGALRVIEGYSATGQKGQDYNLYKTELTRNSDLPLAKTILAKMNQVETDMPITTTARSMSINELGSEINALRTQNAEGKLSSIKQNELAVKESVFAEQMKARSTGDFVTYYKTIGRPVADLTPETVSSQAIENRKQTIAMGKQQFGVEPDAFTSQEAKVWSELFKNGDMKDKQKVAAVVGTLSTTVNADGKVVIDQNRLTKNLKAVSAGDPALEHEIYFRIQGNNESADEMAQGRALLANSPEKFPSKKDITKEAYSVLDELGINKLDPGGVRGKGFASGIMEKYVGKYGKDGAIDSVNTNDLKETAKEFFNVDGFIKMNGETTLPVTPKQKQYEFETMWLNINKDDLLKAGGGKDAFTWMGTTKTPLSVEQIRSKGVLRPVGEGEYVIEMPKATGGIFAGQSYKGDPLIVKDQFGKAIVFNMRSVVDDINKRIIDRVAGTGE